MGLTALQLLLSLCTASLLDLPMVGECGTSPLGAEVSLGSVLLSHCRTVLLYALGAWGLGVYFFYCNTLLIM